LLVLLFATQAKAQISGTVTHEREEPLPNATVLLLPDSIFAITDADGKFSIMPTRNGDHMPWRRPTWPMAASRKAVQLCRAAR
jgi:hypothetical protein